MIDYIFCFLLFFVLICFIFGGACLIGEIYSILYRKARRYFDRRKCALSYLRKCGFDMHKLNRKSNKYLIGLLQTTEEYGNTYFRE